VTAPAPARQCGFRADLPRSAGRGREWRALGDLRLVSTFAFDRFRRSNRRKSPPSRRIFPFSETAAGDRVRSTLRGRPGSPARGEQLPIPGERPAIGGLLRFGNRSPGPGFGRFRVENPDSLPRPFEYSRFGETATGDWVRSLLRGRCGHGLDAPLPGISREPG
jgi:hypothetical protein